MIYLKTYESFQINIAYHGTSNGGFDKFDISKRGNGADQNGFGDYGNGFYFTTSKQSAIAYAEGLTKKGIGNKPYLYTVNLKINNPFSLNKLDDYNRDILSRISINNKNNIKQQDSIINLSSEDIEEIQKKHNINQEDIDLMNDIEGDLSDNWGDWDIASKLKDRGYDSIMVHMKNKHGNEIVVFDEEQIQILKKEPLLKKF